MKTIDSFIIEFIRSAEEHYICLEDKNYSKRSRINKKLIRMLEKLESIENETLVIKKILDSKSYSAILWVANYGLQRKICVEEIVILLEEIKNSSKPSFSISAFTILNNNSLTF